jgi:hypothetical protein
MLRSNYRRNDFYVYETRSITPDRQTMVFYFNWVSTKPAYINLKQVSMYLRYISTSIVVCGKKQATKHITNNVNWRITFWCLKYSINKYTNWVQIAVKKLIVASNILLQIISGWLLVTILIFPHYPSSTNKLKCIVIKLKILTMMLP